MKKVNWGGISMACDLLVEPDEPPADYERACPGPDMEQAIRAMERGETLSHSKEEQP